MGRGGRSPRSDRPQPARGPGCDPRVAPVPHPVRGPADLPAARRGRVSLVAWAIEGRHGWPVDAIVIALIVVAQRRARLCRRRAGRERGRGAGRMTAADRRGRARRPGAARAERELVRGDLLVLGEGDAVGADARLVHARRRCACRKRRSPARASRCSRTRRRCRRRRRSATGSTWSSRARPSRRARGRAVVTATGMAHRDGRDRRAARGAPWRSRRRCRRSRPHRAHARHRRGRDRRRRRRHDPAHLRRSASAGD